MSSTLAQSLLIHGVIVGFFLAATLIDKDKVVKTFEFDLVEKEVVKLKKQNKVVINAQKPKPKAVKKVKKVRVREVFGVKRNTLISEKGSVQAKVGNTLTKKEDDKVLRDDEADSLPEPAEEFLVTSMPRVLEQVRPQYPKWAKEQKIIGSVIFQILIDKRGKVRQVKLLKGLHPKLDALAAEAMKKFKFKPAFIEKEATAVSINYAIKYILES